MIVRIFVCACVIAYVFLCLGAWAHVCLDVSVFVQMIVICNK